MYFHFSQVNSDVSAYSFFTASRCLLRTSRVLLTSFNHRHCRSGGDGQTSSIMAFQGLVSVGLNVLEVCLPLIGQCLQIFMRGHAYGVVNSLTYFWSLQGSLQGSYQGSTQLTSLNATLLTPQMGATPPLRKLAKLARDMYRRHFQAQIRILPLLCAGLPPMWASESGRQPQLTVAI